MAVAVGHCVFTSGGPVAHRYDVELPIEKKIEKIVTDIYGGDGIDISEKAAADIARYKAQGFNDLPICMAKTHLSFSADPTAKVSSRAPAHASGS